MTPEKVKAAFAHQSSACENLGSPFMGTLMRLCATEPWPAGDVRDRVFAWTGDIGPGAQSVPLRLAGALHALRLQGHAGLEAVYPPRKADDATLWAAVSTALVSDTAYLMAWLDSAPQTNEVRRAATLIAVGHVLTDLFDLPLRTSELGASGGLNLHWDRFGLDLHGRMFGHPEPVLTLSPDWEGPLPPGKPAQIVRHAGVDLKPLNPQDAQDALRLRAYLWPDQPHRMTLTEKAIKTATTPVDQSDGIAWLEKRLDHNEGETHLIYTTVAWQYFPTETQERGARLIAEAGAKATKQSPLAWFGMENDGKAKGAALTMRLWPGDITVDLGRADFHGRWVNWKGITGPTQDGIAP